VDSGVAQSNGCIHHRKISSKKRLLRVVAIHRKRCLIEDYFKALKSGCSLEKRQVDSYEGMRHVLCLLAPLAYRLLRLRGLHRTVANEPQVP